MTVIWQRTAQGCLLVTIAWLLTGCGGISASQSISPASVLIPMLGSAPVAEPYSEPEQNESIDEGAAYQS